MTEKTNSEKSLKVAKTPSPAVSSQKEKLYLVLKPILYKNPNSKHYRKVLNKHSILSLSHLTEAEINLLLIKKIVSKTEASKPVYKTVT
jgi:hypothetical protein